MFSKFVEDGRNKTAEFKRLEDERLGKPLISERKKGIQYSSIY